MNRARNFLSAAACLIAVSMGTGGCATKFVAKSVDPLHPAGTKGWDAGELSASTETRLKTLKLARG